MAFSKTTFATLGGFNADTVNVWVYKTADTQATINTAGYFNDMSNQLSVGDLILAWVATGGTPAFVQFVVVSNASGVVDVADGVTVALTDSD